MMSLTLLNQKLLYLSETEVFRSKETKFFNRNLLVFEQYLDYMNLNFLNDLTMNVLKTKKKKK
jgi:hypothetical protein